MIKVYFDLVMISQAESGSKDFKFITELQILDIINKPITLARSLEFKSYLKKLEEEKVLSSDISV